MHALVGNETFGVLFLLFVHAFIKCLCCMRERIFATFYQRMSRERECVAEVYCSRTSREMAGGSSSCASMTNRTASAFANTDLSFEGCSSGCICVCVCVLWKERAHTCTHMCVFASEGKIVELAPEAD